MDTILKFENVSFSYPAEEGTEPVPVLRDICLEIGAGELVAVLGHNGSGKSTLARMTNALLVPDEGTVTVLGMDTRDEERQLDIRQTVGLVFQNPDNQIVATVVEEDVAFALENLGMPPEDIRKRVDSALEAVGMSAYAGHAPHRLSGGQKQRVAIAGVIAMRPKVLVLDEPTAMLDPVGRSEVIGTIQNLCRAHGVTVVMITHHMNEAALCDRVIVMDDGSIRMDGPPGEVFSHHELVRELGLVAPQTVELARMAGVTGAAPLTVEQCARVIFDFLRKGGKAVK